MNGEPVTAGPVQKDGPNDDDQRVQEMAPSAFGGPAQDGVTIAKVRVVSKEVIRQMSGEGGIHKARTKVAYLLLNQSLRTKVFAR